MERLSDLVSRASESLMVKPNYEEYYCKGYRLVDVHCKNLDLAFLGERGDVE